MAGIVASNRPPRPGRVARGGTRPTVGLVLECLEHVYQSTLLAGAEHAAREQDVSLLCFAGGPPVELTRTPNRRHIFTRKGSDTCDALVIATNTLGTFSDLDELLAGRGPFARLPRSSIGAVIPGASSIMIDNAAGMRDVIEHLVVTHGRRAIAFVQGREGNAEADVRFEAYQAVLEHHAIPFDPQLVVPGDFLPQAGRRAVDILCDERGVHFDALVGANDTMALAALQALRARGLTIPHDVAVVGFDDEAAAAADPSTPLTTVRQPIFELGVQGLVDVLRQLEGGSARDNVLPTRLVVRRSCGCGQLTDEIHSPTPSMGGTGDGWRRELELTREQVVEAMGEALSPGFHGTGKTPTRARWLGRVLDAYAGGIERAPGPPFLEELAEAMTETRREGEALSRWNGALSAMREHVGGLLEAQPDAASRPRKRRAEDLLHAGRTLVADLAERLESEHRLKIEGWLRALRRASGDLLQRMGSPTVWEGLAASLGTLDIPGAFVLTRVAEGDESRLDLVAGHPAATSLQGTRIPDDRLLPEGALPADQRTSYVIEPVGTIDDELGHMVVSVGPHEGLIYEALRDNVTSALLGMKLVRRLVEEGRRREVAEKERLEREMQLAVQIQTSILPKTTKVQGFEIAARMLPASEVGGDYYDVLPTADGCWIGIGDVAGHGLTTGLVMLMIQSVVAGVVRANPAASPREVLLALNATMLDNVRARLHQDQHATLTLFRCRPNGRLVFAGAHEELLVWRSRSRLVEVISTPGPWMGASREVETSLVETELRLTPGDILLAHTDGITEARNANGALFGFEQLVKLVRAKAPEGPVRLRDAIFEEVAAFAPVQEDDMTVLTVAHKP